MSISLKQIQEVSATISNEDIAEMQASLVASVDSIIKETLQLAFAQIAESASKALGALLDDFAASAGRVMEEILADIQSNLKALQEAASVLPVDKPIRTTWPLECPVWDCTGESDKGNLN